MIRKSFKTQLMAPIEDQLEEPNDLGQLFNKNKTNGMVIRLEFLLL